MNTVQIKTEDDYDAALAEVDRLMGSPPDSRDGENLEILVTLVEAYEAKHWPIEAPDPMGQKRSLDDPRFIGRTCAPASSPA